MLAARSHASAVRHGCRANTLACARLSTAGGHRPRTDMANELVRTGRNPLGDYTTRLDDLATAQCPPRGTDVPQYLASHSQSGHHHLAIPYRMATRAAAHRAAQAKLVMQGGLPERAPCSNLAAEHERTILGRVCPLHATLVISSLCDSSGLRKIIDRLTSSVEL